jgi:hypothetical protein
MPSVEASGTQSATVTTEHTLATITTSDVLILVVDCSNMVNADSVELRVKRKVLSGGAQALAYFARYKHVQGDPVKVSIPIPSPHEAVFTLKQTEGTSRNFPWSIESI